MSSGNIPGLPLALPGVYSQVQTLSSATSVPGGIRVSAIIGEGARPETIVASALGGGKDGLNSSFSSTTGANGTYFSLQLAPVISNRTTLYKNGIALVGTEALINSSPFSSAYDYRLDIATGHIQLQSSSLVDQGGLFYRVSGTNSGTGTISQLTLVDSFAPEENWVIKCVSVSRNALGQPIAGTSKFVASGSISGNVLNALGQQVVWVSNSVIVSNGILSFAINQTGTNVLVPGDSFVVQVQSGVLNANDSLTAIYIPTQNLNNPTFISDKSIIQGNFGVPSYSDNRLALGCQLAFANGAPGIMCVQAAPPVPRRTSFELDLDPINAESTNQDDFIFALPVGVLPDQNSQIHFFVTDPSTAIETQVLPNEFPFFTLGTSGQPSVNTFIFDNNDPPAGNAYSYSVISQNAADIIGYDGYITPAADGNPSHCLFASASVTFTSANVGDVLQVFDAAFAANNANGGYPVTGPGTGFLIDSVVNGMIYGYLCTVNASTLEFEALTSVFPDFINIGSGVAFQVVNPATNQAVAGGTGTDGSIVALINTGDAYFTSASQVNFGSISGIDGYQLLISGTVVDDGYYTISAPSGGQITISKTVCTEYGLRFEVIDSLNTGNFVVVNHNVVPNGNTLRITYVDSRDASFYDAGWEAALATLEAQEIDILVTLPSQTISIIFQNAFNHCITMSSIGNKKERVFFTGAINGLTPANLTGAQLAAVESLGVFEGVPNNDIATLPSDELEDIANYSVVDAFGDVAQAYRAVYFYPDQIIVTANGNNTVIDGFYIAAAAAGYASGVTNVAIPFTNKVFSGLTILNNKQFSPLVLGQLAAAGVCVLQPVQGGGNVVWGITTSQSGATEEQEISIVFIRDRISKSMRLGFQGYIGIAEDGNIIETLSARANALLKAYLNTLITAYQDLLVVQDSVDPTQYNVSVLIAPVYPVNRILITFSVGVL